MTGKSIGSEEEKAEIVMEAPFGNSSIAKICRRYNVISSSLYKWRDDFMDESTASLQFRK